MTKYSGLSELELDIQIKAKLYPTGDEVYLEDFSSLQPFIGKFLMDPASYIANSFAHEIFSVKSEEHPDEKSYEKKIRRITKEHLLWMIETNSSKPAVR